MNNKAQKSGKRHTAKKSLIDLIVEAANKKNGNTQESVNNSTNKEDVKMEKQINKKAEQKLNDAIALEEFRNDLKNFVTEYFDGNYSCSTQAAFDFSNRMRAQAETQIRLHKTSDEQIIADHKAIGECMELLHQDFAKNHDAAKKKIDECLDRYLPGLREFREASTPGDK